MKSADWEHIATPALDRDWRLSKALAYTVPVGWILHGLLGESSGDTAGFYLWTVRLPLFVPTEVIDLSWSDRFGGSSHLHQIGAKATEEALLEAAGQVRTEAHSKSHVLSPPGGADSVRMQEARGYGLLLEDNPAGAVEVLGRVERYEAKYSWEQELVKRAASIRAMLLNDRSKDALRCLGHWRRESAAALGVLLEES